MTRTEPITAKEAMKTLPDGWRWVKLGEVCEIIAGQSPPSETYRKSPEGLPFFQGKADFGERHPVPRVWCVAPVKVALAGDILLSVRAPVGPTNIADIKCCIGRGLAAVRPGDLADRDFILAALRLYEDNLAEIGRGSTFAAIKREDLESLAIPLPPLSEQKRIAAILNEQMAAVERARAATAEQLEAAKVLPPAYLRAVFNSPEAHQWPRKRLGDVCEEKTGTRDPRLEPDKMFRYVDITGVDNIAKRIVVAKTLIGKNAPSRARQVIRAGDTIVSTTRPNLNAVALVPPELNSEVCSTGFCVLRARDGLDRLYLFAFVQSPDFVRALSDLVRGALYPAVTDKEVLAQTIPFPPPSEQQRITAMLSDQMAAAERTRKTLEEQLYTINRLPAALLRRAFSGEITPFQRKKASLTSRKGIVFKRGAIASYIINRLGQQPTFGRVQLQKILYLTEAHVGVDLAGEYFREAAGPLDSGFLYGLESLAQKQGWFTKHSRKKALGYYYRPGPNISGRVRAAHTILGNHRNEMDRLLDLFAEIDTEQAEIVTTLFAAWNDFLLDRQNFTDQEIIQEVKTNWHKAKERISNEKLKAGLNWLKEQRITPQGIGPRTMVKKKRRGSSGSRSKRRK